MGKSLVFWPEYLFTYHIKSSCGLFGVDYSYLVSNEDLEKFRSYFDDYRILIP